MSRSVTTSATIAVAVLCSFVVAGFLWFRFHPRYRCDLWEKQILQVAGEPTVYQVEEGCSGYLNGGKFSIVLGDLNGKRTEIFKYEDVSWSAEMHGKTTLSAQWIARDHLRISIGAVGPVETKVLKAGTIVIEYDIGQELLQGTGGTRT